MNRLVAFIYLFFWLLAFKLCCFFKKSFNCLFHIALQKGLAVDFNLSKNQKDVVPVCEMSASVKSYFQIVLPYYHYVAADVNDWSEAT